MFPYKPSILGIPVYGNPHIGTTSILRWMFPRHVWPEGKPIIWIQVVDLGNFWLFWQYYCIHPYHWLVIYTPITYIVFLAYRYISPSYLRKWSVWSLHSMHFAACPTTGRIKGGIYHPTCNIFLWWTSTTSTRWGPQTMAKLVYDLLN